MPMRWRLVFRALASAALFACMLWGTSAHAVVYPAAVDAELEQRTSAFVDVDGFARMEFDAAFWDDFFSERYFPEMADWEGVFLPDSGVSPIAHVIMLLEVREGQLPRARYHVEIERQPSPTPDFPNIMRAHVQVTRFNLGPVLRRELLAVQDAGTIAPPEVFGVGPHVRWRVVIGQIQGHNAHAVAASSKVLSPTEAAAADCLGTPCLSTDRAWGPQDGWLDPPLAPNTKPVGSVRAAVAADELSHMILGRDGYGETLEGVPPGTPQATMVISQGVDGQDPPVVAVAFEPRMLDDAIQSQWTRRIASGGSIEWKVLPIYRPGRN